VAKTISAQNALAVRLRMFIGIPPMLDALSGGRLARTYRFRSFHKQKTQPPPRIWNGIGRKFQHHKDVKDWKRSMIFQGVRIGESASGQIF